MTTLEEHLASLVKGAEKFKEENGSVKVTVGPNSPIAQAGIERVSGFPINVEAVTLVSHKPDEEDIVIDGPLVYFSEPNTEGVTIKDIASSIDWLGGFGDIDWFSADYSGVETKGQVYLEGKRGDIEITAALHIVEYTAFSEPDFGDEDDLDEGDED